MNITWNMLDHDVLYTEDYDLFKEMLSICGVEKFGTYRDHKRGIFAWQVRYPKTLRQGVETSKRQFEKAQKDTPKSS